MANLLTSKDLQALIRVDRSTIYRMAEDGRLPAIKVGRQWRFPEERIRAWLRDVDLGTDGGEIARPSSRLAALVAPATLQAFADVAAESFGAMTVITDIDGTPLTKVSNPCALFDLVGSIPENVERCVRDWARYSTDPDFDVRFEPSEVFGFLCARGFVRLEHELVGMLLVGGVRPETWPPPADRIDAMAAELFVPAGVLRERIMEVHELGVDDQRRVLALLPKMCALLSRLAADRRTTDKHERRSL